jgi:prepilin-type processing-associated H-X9-DG protein
MRIFSSPLISVLLGLLGVAVAAVILVPPGCGGRQSARRSACQSNLKQIALACHQYTQDYDGRWPLVAGVSAPYTYPGASGSFGWADMLQPYLRSTSIFQCPSEGSGPASPPSSSDPQFTDYWFNARLAKVNETALRFPRMTFLLGEGNDGRQRCDTRYALAEIPKSWLTGDGFPTRRHLDGGNYAFADGHVKWLQPKGVSNGEASDMRFGIKPGRLLPVRE